MQHNCIRYEKNNKVKTSKKGSLTAAGFIAAAAVTSGILLSGCFGGSPDVNITGDMSDLEVVEYILEDSPNYKRSGRLVVSGLMLHSIGTPVSDAKYLADVFGEPDYTRAGVHAFIDANTGEVYQTLPWNRVAWHCGGDGMLSHIGVEMCETEAAYYDDSYAIHITDAAQAKKDCKTAYDSAVKLFARLCDEYGLDPLKDGVIISHAEGYERGIATNHGDPEHYWDAVGLGYTMDGFRNDVYNLMEE